MLDLLDDQLSLFEAQTIQHTDFCGWRGYATLNTRENPKSRLSETLFPVEQMPFVIRECLREKRRQHDIFIAQHSYSSRARRTDSLLSLNCGHIDLDTYRTNFAEESREFFLKTFLSTLEQRGIPLPSYIVSSGRGYQAKWIWRSPLDPKALPRWQVAHRHLIENVLFDFGADEKAILPTQIMRLVGSINQKNDAAVTVCWVNGGDFSAPEKVDFEAWAKAVLPFSRGEVKEFRARLAQYAEWDVENDENRAKLAAVQGKDAASARAARETAWKQVGAAMGFSTFALDSVDDLLAGEIWQRRLGFMDRLLAYRGHRDGVPRGERNEWMWIAANALGWVNRGNPGALRDDLTFWAQKRIPTFTAAEAKTAAASVLRRVHEAQGHGKGLYRMGEATFRRLLHVSDAELVALTTASKPRQEQNVAIGAMGFEPMRGLSFDEYLSETQKRQQASAKRTNEALGRGDEERRAKAAKMRENGMTPTAIAKEIGVSRVTVYKWLSSKV